MNGNDIIDTCNINGIVLIPDGNNIRYLCSSGTIPLPLKELIVCNKTEILNELKYPPSKIEQDCRDLYIESFAVLNDYYPLSLRDIKYYFPEKYQKIMDLWKRLDDTFIAVRTKQLPFDVFQDHLSQLLDRIIEGLGSVLNKRRE